MTIGLEGAIDSSGIQNPAGHIQLLNTDTSIKLNWMRNSLLLNSHQVYRFVTTVL